MSDLRYAIRWSTPSHDRVYLSSLRAGDPGVTEATDAFRCETLSEASTLLIDVLHHQGPLMGLRIVVMEQRPKIEWEALAGSEISRLGWLVDGAIYSLFSKAIVHRDATVVRSCQRAAVWAEVDS